MHILADISREWFYFILAYLAKLLPIPNHVPLDDYPMTVGWVSSYHLRPGIWGLHSVDQRLSDQNQMELAIT
jgi:hypothetical protein